MLSGARNSVAVAIVAVIALTSGCSGRDEAHEVTVFAAASLADVFLGVATDLENSGGPSIVFSFAGSSTLAAQIIEGAPADVFASANLEQMNRVARAVGQSTSPVIFAVNQLVIVVERGNPRAISGLLDLGRKDVVVALADPSVPAGAYAAEIIDAAGIEMQPATYEADVRAVLTKVQLGEVDAGIVYLTDAMASLETDTILLPDEVSRTANYPVISLAAGNSDAQAFIDQLLSPKGRERLAAHGFMLP